jgi:hypothetical protein
MSAITHVLLRQTDRVVTIHGLWTLVYCIAAATKCIAGSVFHNIKRQAERRNNIDFIQHLQAL